jgi:putative transposase
MDGKGRWADNIPIERWFRTFKYEEIYLKDYGSPKEARSEIGKFIYDYNFKRIHSAINTVPAKSYYPELLYQMITTEFPATLYWTA